MEDLDEIFDEQQIIDDTNTNIIETEDYSDNIFDSVNDNIKENSLIDDLLKAKGIENAKVKIIDENENEEEVDFYSLSKEDQLSILNSEESKPRDNNLDLEESEIDLLNHLRSNNLSISEFLETYKQSVIDELNIPSTENYEIDAYDDQELYMLDLQQKYNLTDEELAKELEKELQDETLFKKKVDILRAEYKTLEDQYKQGQQQEFEEQRQQQYNQFSEQMVDVALATPEFYGIELEDDEKNEVLSFLLDLDDNGTSNFYKSLNDPKKLYEAAWFLRYGKESFEALKNAYESEINKLKNPDKPKPIIRNNANDQKKSSIYDLNF